MQRDALGFHDAGSNDVSSVGTTGDAAAVAGSIPTGSGGGGGTASGSYYSSSSGLVAASYETQPLKQEEVVPDMGQPSWAKESSYQTGYSEPQWASAAGAETPSYHAYHTGSGLLRTWPGRMRAMWRVLRLGTLLTLNSNSRSNNQLSSSSCTSIKPKELIQPIGAAAAATSSATRWVWESRICQSLSALCNELRNRVGSETRAGLHILWLAKLGDHMEYTAQVSQLAANSPRGLSLGPFVLSFLFFFFFLSMDIVFLSRLCRSFCSFLGTRQGALTPSCLLAGPSALLYLYVPLLPPAT
ncbi:hypothetical protein RHS01_00262 [Rhizoctonia solani]|uniref:Uncharacterized protein n=1 Tax=Rhizoctonia solani TaxID=456999 RepID=A0A8H7IMK0_9AGAM|nr:hypothetical protein RHS01_00262 [Rhizoctonia solani]